MTIYLVQVVERADRFAEVAAVHDAFEADLGLWFIATEEPLSRLYHSLKHQLRPHGPLFVVEMHAPPKFKNLKPGALSWIRARFQR